MHSASVSSAPKSCSLPESSQHTDIPAHCARCRGRGDVCCGGIIEKNTTQPIHLQHVTAGLKHAAKAELSEGPSSLTGFPVRDARSGDAPLLSGLSRCRKYRSKKSDRAAHTNSTHHKKKILLKMMTSRRSKRDSQYSSRTTFYDVCV